jgi:iron complex outermembrane receptor protein
MQIIRSRTRWLLSALILLAAWPLQAQAYRSAPGATRAEERQDGAIFGRVLTEGTDEPIAAASVRLLELGRGELSHRDGTFHFGGLPAGTFTVAVQRLGFAPAQQTLTVGASDTAQVVVRLAPSAINIPGVVVTGTGRARSASEAYRPTTVLDEAELRRQLGSSLAATLANQAGISQRYNGPAASQPVIRGLSGDRVLVLEDGERTGDIASTSADHAVAIEPLTAERIEVLRGPAGLLYGSNALGGVINVVREEVPRTIPEELSGTFSAQMESVNRGATAGGDLSGALGSFVWRGELSGRIAGDTHTPIGILSGTDLAGYNSAAGLSYVRSRGYAGAAVRDYAMEYGIPGSFQGELIPGGHEGGVVIDMRRTSVTAEAGLLSDVRPFSALEWDGRYTRYEHQEIEPSGGVGTTFGQLTASSRVAAPHRHQAGGVLTEGQIGVSGLWQDLRSAGSSGTEPARSLSLAAFLFEELAVGRLRLQLGGRYDWTRITPEEVGRTSIGQVRQREFGALSGSAAALFLAGEGITLGASASRAFRTPSVTELFSNGPHLADYSFNVGNPDLEAEYGFGVDIFSRFAFERLNGEVAVYRNWIQDYIFYAPTGRLDPRLGRFPLYRASADDAVLQGAEGRVQWEAAPRLVLDATASYVHATRDGSDTPLPAIPPLHGSAGVRYDLRRFFLSAGWQGAARQDRVGEFERPTPGYSLWRAGGGMRWSAFGDLHTLNVQVTNLTDEVWRDHLSRIKEVAPQPGRNLEILYRVSF